MEAAGLPTGEAPSVGSRMQHPEGATLPAPPPGGSQHHTRRPCAPKKDNKRYFGTTDLKDIQRYISIMGQRDLQVRLFSAEMASVVRQHVSFLLGPLLVVQEKFDEVYKASTMSNNNSWLRRKLLEGMQGPLKLVDASQLGNSTQS